MSFELTEDALGRLSLKRPDQPDAADVRLKRAFPWTRPEQHISIRSSEGKELVLVEDLTKLDPAQRQLIEKTLAGTSFIPRITRVKGIDMSFGYQEWTVDTDRGPANFRVQEREDVRFLGPGRFRIKDADGNVYELASYEAMDLHSQKQLASLF